MTILFKSWCMISSPFSQHLQKVLSLSLSLSHCNFILILQEKHQFLISFVRCLVWLLVDSLIFPAIDMICDLILFNL